MRALPTRLHLVNQIIMAVETMINSFFTVMILLFTFTSRCEAIKCFECNSQNNSACLDMHLQKMAAIVPIVDCSQSVSNSIGKKEFFCRKITQTILHTDQTPEIRITRGCGWVKHKRECYKADNQDHLETVCQCFGDMCNAATTFENVKMTILTTVIGVFATFKTWRGEL